MGAIMGGPPFIPQNMDKDTQNLIMEIYKQLDKLNGKLGAGLSHKDLKDTEDHEEYVKIDGSRAMIAPLDMGNQSILRARNDILRADVKQGDVVVNTENNQLTLVQEGSFSSNISTADSKGVSSGTRASTADSKAVSNSTNISSNSSKVTSSISGGTLSGNTINGPTISGGTMTGTGISVDTISEKTAATGIAIDGVTLKDSAVTAVGGVNTDGTNLLIQKVYSIGDWNMDTTDSVNVAHGLTLANIRNVQCVVRNDANNNLIALEYLGNGGFSINSTGPNIVLTRSVGGAFDNTNFDSTSYNRGYVTITYTP